MFGVWVFVVLLNVTFKFSEVFCEGRSEFFFFEFPLMVSLIKLWKPRSKHLFNNISEWHFEVITLLNWAKISIIDLGYMWFKKFNIFSIEQSQSKKLNIFKSVLELLKEVVRGF